MSDFVRIEDGEKLNQLRRISACRYIPYRPRENPCPWFNFSAAICAITFDNSAWGCSMVDNARQEG